ncbi:glycerophosphodiester phosphodiesterase [Stutzerimonas azotifigens]|uniref:glycerophosphodiester phosphodiesterase n=1 Tax=Stutzerimonas azotifigens TaxID=291995 RepID=UPI000424E1B2|nr:glycerophosphodiester phosphodiesterase [Stutzerimonas azotifigens]
MLRSLRFLLAPVLVIAAVLGLLGLTSRPVAEPAVLAPFDGDRPLVIAHRGGMGLWPENSLFAFQRASEIGVDMLEMDVRLSRDGQVVVIHDETLERTTDGQGPVAEHDLAALRRLDAGYAWSADGGQSYPYRGQSIGIPTFEEVLQAVPQMPKVVEIKVPDVGLEDRLCELIRDSGQRDRIVVGSFHDRSLERFRGLCPGVATSAGANAVRLLVLLEHLGLAGLLSPNYQLLQIPPQHDGQPVATPGLLASARERGLHTQLWTINEQPQMRQLMDMGAQGLITDYPDRALQLLNARRQQYARTEREPAETEQP